MQYFHFITSNILYAQQQIFESRRYEVDTQCKKMIVKSKNMNYFFICRKFADKGIQCLDKK